MGTERKGVLWRAANWALVTLPDWVSLGLLLLLFLISSTTPVLREIGAILIAGLLGWAALYILAAVISAKTKDSGRENERF